MKRRKKSIDARPLTGEMSNIDAAKEPAKDVKEGEEADGEGADGEGEEGEGASKIVKPVTPPPEKDPHEEEKRQSEKEQFLKNVKLRKSEIPASCFRPLMKQSVIEVLEDMYVVAIHPQPAFEDVLIVFQAC